MKTLILILVASIATPAFAQYKCVVNGKTVYSDAPCAANSKYVGALEDNVSQSARQDAELLRRKQAFERSQIDRDQEMAMRQGQQTLARQAAADDAQARAKAARCAEHRQEMASNKRAQARYQDWGWQQSLNNRQQEAKAINDNMFRDCP